LGLGAITKSQQAVILQRVSQGESVCPELLAPTIVVDDRGVSLDGHFVVARSAFPSGVLKPIQKLELFLKADKELWRSTHPADMTFAPETSLRIAGDVDVVAGTNVVVTAALAGYESMHLRVGATQLDFAWAELRDGSDDDASVVLTVLLRDDGELDVRFGGDVFTYGISFGSGPKDSGAAPPPEPLHTVADGAAAVDFVTKRCAADAARCADIVEVHATRGSFESLVSVARAVLGATPFVAHVPKVRLLAAPL
jgi:hypothetical protein